MALAQTRLNGGRPPQLPDVKSPTSRRAVIAVLGAIALASPGATTIAAAAAPAFHRSATSARIAAAPVVQDDLAQVSSHKTVAFQGHYRGTASLLIKNGSVSIVSVSGKGFATLIGTSAVSGSGTASASAQCDPFTGTGTIRGKTGKITLKALQSKSSGCSSGPSGAVTVTFNGVAVVIGGTGVAKGASGTVKFTGALKLAGTSGPQNGPYTVVLSGTLAVAG